MPKPFVFVTRQISENGIQLLKDKGYRVVVSKKDGVLTKKELFAAVKGADAILSLLTDKIDSDVLDAAGTQLKIVANFAVGFDNIVLDDAKKRGVIVTNTPSDAVNDAVAEHAFALMCALAHRVAEADVYAKAKKYQGWNPDLLVGTQLKGKTLGIIGLGRIGRSVAEHAVHGFGMKCLYSDQRRQPDFDQEFSAKYVGIDRLLQEADFVSLHVPLLPSTYHLISTEQFSLMKKTAFLINTARGPVVDEKALLRALKTKRIAGAALDVFECEPAIDCDLSDTLELKNFSNVILTPHIASATKEARESMSEIAAQNIIAVLSGRAPLNPAK